MPMTTFHQLMRQALLRNSEPDYESTGTQPPIGTPACKGPDAAADRRVSVSTRDTIIASTRPSSPEEEEDDIFMPPQFYISQDLLDALSPHRLFDAADDDESTIINEPVWPSILSAEAPAFYPHRQLSPLSEVFVPGAELVTSQLSPLAAPFVPAAEQGIEGLEELEEDLYI